MDGAVATSLIQSMAATGVCAGISDCVAQYWEIRTPPPSTAPPYQFQRTLRFGTIAFVWGGVTLWLRYAFLKTSFPAAGIAVAFQKACINQLIFGPPGLAGLYFLNSVVHTGGDWGKGWRKVKKELFWSQGYMILLNIPVNTFMFYTLHSVVTQVVFVRVWDLMYYTFVAWVSARGEIEFVAPGGRTQDMVSGYVASPSPSPRTGPETPREEARPTPRAARGPCKCMQSCVVS